MEVMKNGLLYNDDCMKVLPQLGGASVDLILTDVPYNISKDNNFSTMNFNRTGVDFGSWDYGFDITQLLGFIPILKPNGSMIIFHSIEQYGQLLQAMQGLMEAKDRLIWEKTNPMPRNTTRRYVSNIEMCSWWTVPKGKWTFNKQHEPYDSCVMRYPVSDGKRYHPTQKNIHLIDELILRHSNPGDTILDPFMGCGSTCVSAVKNGRQYIGIEIDKHYYDIAKERLNG